MYCQTLSTQLSQTKPDVDKLHRLCQAICSVINDPSVRENIERQLLAVDANIYELQTHLGNAQEL